MSFGKIELARNIICRLAALRGICDENFELRVFCEALADSIRFSLADTTTTSRDYAVPSDLTKTLLVNPSAAQMGPYPSTSTLPHQPVNPAYQGSLYRPGHAPSVPVVPVIPPSPTPYATADVVAPPIQGVSGNTVYAVSNNMDLLWKEELSVMEIPRENLKMIDKLGEGQFGEVSVLFDRSQVMWLTLRSRHFRCICVRSCLSC